MTIKVYVWLPEGGSRYGHASMELSDGTYISWYPVKERKQRTMGKSPGCQERKLEDDAQEEGRNPDRIFIIPSKVGLDEGNIKRWWASMKSSEEWSLLFNNCCDAVKRGIEAGGAKVTKSWIERPKKLVKYMEDWKARNWKPSQSN